MSRASGPEVGATGTGRLGASAAAVRLSESKRPNTGPSSESLAFDLSRGDPSFDTPDYIAEAAIEAIRAGYTHYPPAAGDPELRQAIASQLSTRAASPYAASDIFVSNGAAGAIYAVMAASLDPGDDVIVGDPSYSLYPAVGAMLGATVRAVPSIDGLRPDLEQMRDAIGSRTKMIIFDNPCNPTGTVMTREELEFLVEVAERTGVMLVADETYADLVYDGKTAVSLASIPSSAARAIVINTCSKSYAMTGWRVGYVAARDGLTRHIGAVHHTSVGGVNWIAQRAALAAFTVQSDWLPTTRALYDVRRLEMTRLVNETKYLSCHLPEGAFYAFVRLPHGVSSEQIVAAAGARGVGVRSGVEFGAAGEGFVRLTFAGDPESFGPAIQILDEIAASS